MSHVQRLLLLLPFLIISLVYVDCSEAQSLPEGVDIETVRSDDLSDGQVRELDAEIESQGITLDQFSALAIQRGAQRNEVSRIVQRIRQLRTLGEEEEITEREESGQTRELARMDSIFVDFETEQDTIPREERVFGMSLFNQISRTFEPSFNIPTPRNYTVGAGDQIVIDVWGAAEMTYQLIVNAEGAITIQNLGPIYLNGLTIEEASERIKRRLGDIYSGLDPDQEEQANTFAEVSLGNVRSIKVTVMGEVKAPGTYTVSSLSTAFNALFAAGGPDRDGSFRDVQIIRGNEIIENFDLYDILVTGNQEGNIQLKDQDIIKVNPYQNRVQVLGETKRVGYFETKVGETLDDLVDYFGGFTDMAYTERLVLKRRTPTMRSVSDVEYPEGNDLEIRNGDILEVGEVLDRFENRVTIRGAVFRPGEYELNEEMTLNDLIYKADGPKEDAHYQRGVIYRTTDNLTIETIPFSLRNVIDEPETYDIELKRDDEIRIASLFELREDYNIRVSGAVNNPGQYDFTEETTLQDAILQANGFRDDAAEYRIEVARRIVDEEKQLKSDSVAEVFQFEVDENLSFSEEDKNFVLRPFDQVFVRLKPNYQEQQIVRIEGEVQFPGEYVLEDRTARLSDIIEWAGGLSDYAYPQGASLERTMGEIEVEEESVVGDLVRLDGQTTRVGIELGDALQNPQSNVDLILEEGDVIRVPKQLQTVRIEGEVLFPVSVRYENSKSFSDYLSAAGGVTEEGRRNRAYVVYANGEVDRTKRFLFIRNNPDIEPGATIVIPEKPEQRELSPQERVSLASSIASTAILFITLIDRLER